MAGEDEDKRSPGAPGWKKRGGEGAGEAGRGRTGTLTEGPTGCRALAARGALQVGLSLLLRLCSFPAPLVLHSGAPSLDCFSPRVLTPAESTFHMLHAGLPPRSVLMTRQEGP